jgi:hypothetical protein
MSALGQKRTCAVQKGMSALPPKATSNATIAHWNCNLRRRQARSPWRPPRVLLMDESDKPKLELLAKLAEQLASLQRECSELRRELDERIKVQQEQLKQLAALKAKYDQLCRERDDFRKALEEQLTLNPAFCVMPDPNTEH